MSTTADWQGRFWWRFVVRPARITRAGWFQSPIFLAAGDPVLPAGRHPRPDDPVTRLALDSVLADGIRAGWALLRRGPFWFSIRFSRPRLRPRPHRLSRLPRLPRPRLTPRPPHEGFADQPPAQTAIAC